MRFWKSICLVLMEKILVDERRVFLDTKAKACSRFLFLRWRDWDFFSA